MGYYLRMVVPMQIPAQSPQSLNVLQTTTSMTTWMMIAIMVEMAGFLHEGAAPDDDDDEYGGDGDGAMVMHMMVIVRATAKLENSDKDD